MSLLLLFPSGGGAPASLAGSASLTITASASLTTAIRLTGAATLRVTASAVLGPPVTVPVPVFTIAGVDRTSRVHVATGADIQYTLGGRAIARLKTVDASSNSTATAYAPDIDETVAVDFNSVTHFAGNVVGKTIGAILDPAKGIGTAIDAVDYSAALDQRLVTVTFPASGSWNTGLIIQYIISTYLAVYGITAESGMPDGATLSTDLVIDKLTVRAALNRIAILNNWIWRLTPAKVIQAGPIGSFTAPYSLTTANSKILGGVSWRKTRTRYTNRVTVIYGGERVVLKTIDIVGNGTATSWPLDYVPLLNFSGDVVSQGVVSEQGNLYYPLFGTVGGVTWSYNSGTNSLERSPALPNTYTATWSYAVQFPATATVEDPSEITAHGPYELQVRADDITDAASAGALATAELARGTVVPREVTVATAEGMVFPGDVVTLTVAERSLSGSWLITGVNARTVSNNRFEYELTCLEGSVSQSTWLDYLNDVYGGAGSAVGSMGTFTGNFIPAQSGIATYDVIANAALDSTTTGAESSLRGLLNPGITKQGPALQLGRPDNQHTWAIIADYVAAGPVVRTLMFTPWAERGTTTPYAMALQQDPATPVAGEYYLIPYATKKLWLGGDPAVYGGSAYRIEKIFTKDIDSNGPGNVSGNFTVGGTLGVTGNATFSAEAIATIGLKERSRSARLGEWTAVSFSAGNFTANGSMTWTVASGDQITYGYSIHGKTMTVAFDLATTTVGGTLNNALQIAIPGGYTAATTIYSGLGLLIDNGTRTTGSCNVGTGGTVIAIVRTDNANFTASTDNTYVAGEITFEVQ